MGRPKGYNREQVLEKAMELFWTQGFEATSTQQLVEHLGINRNSMYSEFGTKREFFETALRHYEEFWVAKNFGPLEASGAGLDSIIAVFDHYASIGKGRRSGMGCMLCNASVELGSPDAPAHDLSRRLFERVTKAFENALQGARTQGQLNPAVDIPTQARTLTSMWLGMLVLARAKAPGDLLDAVPTAVRQLAQVAEA